MSDDIDLIDAMVCWTPKRAALENDLTYGVVKVFRHPDEGRASRSLRMSAGACDFGWKTKFDERQRKLMLLLHFHHMIVRDGIDPRTAHYEFQVIPEYRAMMAYDCLSPILAIAEVYE